MLNCQRSLSLLNPNCSVTCRFFHSLLPFMKIEQLRGYLLINICSPSLQTSLFVILCRWRLFPNRCATLSFSRALCGLFNRVINFWISVFSPLFAVRFCMTALVDRLQHTGRCISQFSAPSLRKRALALLCKVRAKWAPLPLALSTVVLESAPSLKRWLRDGWWLVIEVETRANLMSRPQDLFMGLQWTAN